MAKKVSAKKIEDQLSGVLDKLNSHLRDMPYRLDLVDPKNLILMKKNARYMKLETFSRLTQNIKNDGNLSSVPFCYKDKKGRYHVLSGNHRVQAALEAGVERVLILYSSGLDKDKQTAIQLSHNAIEGNDDFAILKDLWDSITDIDQKIYAGLDSEVLEELEKIKFEGFSEQRLDYKSASFLFLPEELEKAHEVFEKIHILYKKEKVYVVSLKAWEKFFDLIANIKTSCEIKNSATAFSYLLDLAKERMDEMRPPDGGYSGDQPE